MTAWLLLANETWSGDTQTMLGGGRKAWSKTLQSTTREVSFSFSFPKSLSCDVVLPSPAAAHSTQSIWCLRWRIGNWCSLTHYPLTQDNDKAQAATTEMVFVYRECMICVGDRSRYSLFQCWTLSMYIYQFCFHFLLWQIGEASSVQWTNALEEENVGGTISCFTKHWSWRSCFCAAQLQSCTIHLTLVKHLGSCGNCQTIRKP